LAIPALILAHFFAGIVSAFLSADQPAPTSAVLIAIVFCQASLLGMWGGLGSTNWLVRCLGVTAGIMYLYVELGLGISELDFAVFCLVAIATCLVGAITWLVRLFKAVLKKGVAAESETREGLQFTIRHLMLLTLLIACLMTVGKLLAPLVQGSHLTAQIAVLGVCYAAVALASIWAILGLGRPVIRSIFVVLISLGAGAAGGYVIESSGSIGFWIATTVLQAILLVGSLCVVRGAGYRLLAKARAPVSARSSDTARSGA
jgi:hypothetical protein